MHGTGEAKRSFKGNSDDLNERISEKEPVFLADNGGMICESSSKSKVWSGLYAVHGCP